MPNYVVELYRSGSDAEPLQAVAEGLAAGARDHCRRGTLVRYVETLFLPGDGTCLHLFEAVFVRIGVAASLIAAVAFGTLARDADASVEVGPDVRIYGSTAKLVDLGRWAVGRFEASGLEAPPVEIHFHQELSDCAGHLGFARDGRIDLCTELVDAPARRALLHEIGHIWLDVNTTGSLRDRFLESRGLRSWNASDDPWELRGYEQGAEILAWGLGERILTPSIPDNEPEQLAEAFALLTGNQIPNPQEVQRS